jgi:hypothetical protein
MASFFGKSKVWGEICAKLESAGLKVENPRDIEPLLESCLSEYSQKYRQFHHKLESEVWQLEVELSQEKEKIGNEVETFSNFSSLEIAQAEANIDLLRHDRSLFNVIRNKFRTRRETRKIIRLKNELLEKKQALESPLKIKETELAQRKGSIDLLARRECQDLINTIDLLKSLSSSQDLAVAAAEMEMLEYLKQLPANYYVINNVNLSVEKGFNFEGKWLIHGHIDHLVITPSGLFAIEVRNWNKQTIEKNSPNDPAAQIKFASQLCYEIIKPAFPGVTVRSILAFRGHPPEFQTSGIVKLMPIQEVPAYIIWFKDNTLTNQAAHQLLSRIQEINKS